MGSTNRAFRRKAAKMAHGIGMTAKEINEQAAQRMADDKIARAIRTMIVAACLTTTQKYGKLKKADTRLDDTISILHEYVDKVNRGDLTTEEYKVMDAVMDSFRRGRPHG
ncbi:hypothetical protein [Phascolarctobacterium sp.]|uniref:hypothetical protein n=1 Tax=Phascolarctobacterium sp. TaxID=2049039 RepID=UPI00386A4EF0